MIEKRHQHFIKLAALVGGIILIIVLIGSYIYRGYIVVDIPREEITEVIYANSNSPEEVNRDDADRIAVRPGTYTVEVRLENGATYFKEVIVPAWLGSTTIEPKVIENRITRVSVDTFPNLALSDNLIASYETNGAIKRTPINIIPEVASEIDTTSEAALLKNKITLSPTKIAGVLTDIEDYYVPVIYDFSNEQTRRFAADEINQSAASIQLSAANSGFTLYDQDEKAIHFYDSEDNVRNLRTYTVSIDKFTIALNRDRPIYSAAADKIVLLEGNDFTIDEDHGPDDKDTKDIQSKLIVLNTKGDVTRKINIPSDQSVYDIKLSPDAKYVSVSSTYALFIYSLDSGEKLFTIPIEHTDVLWSEDDELLFSVPSQGLYKASLTNKEAVNILPGRTLRISDISFIQQRQLYFSAFTIKDTTTSTPDAYTLNLDIVADDNSISSKLPIIEEEYTIDYIANKLVVTTLRYTDSTGWSDAPAETEAREKAAELVQDFPQYSAEYRYTNVYIND